MVPHLGHTETVIVVVPAGGLLCALANTQRVNSHCFTLNGNILNLLLQAATPSNHLWSTFLLRAPPQFLNQAPPGAQQLYLPDFSNVPHLGHVIVLVTVEVTAGSVLTDVAIGVLTISSRSGNG